MKSLAALVVLLLLFAPVTLGQDRSRGSKSLSCIYPHLAMFNNEGECGTGAVVLTHTATKDVTLRVELDLNGSGLWRTYESFVVPPGKDVAHDFPAALTGYWLRIVADSDCQATAQLRYE